MSRGMVSRGKMWRVVALFTGLAPVFAVADWLGQCVLLMRHGAERSIWYESAQNCRRGGHRRIFETMKTTS